MSEELRSAREALGNRLGGYQAIFNAIGDAVNTNAIGIGISVEAFLNALPDDAPALIDHLEADGGVAWLVERTDTDRPTWFAASCPNIKRPNAWTTDASKAVRFCREQDANEIVLLLNLVAPTSVIATEHHWLSALPVLGVGR